MTRRDFLVKMAALYGMTVLPTLAETAKNNKSLVVIFLRGGVDGLHAVVPTFEDIYYETRPTIALKKTLPLINGFGANPAMAPLMESWQDGDLGFVHACGLKEANRSHFEAQHIIERGMASAKNEVPDGWMNRLVSVLPYRSTPSAALTLTPTIPEIFEGKNHVATFDFGTIHKPIALDKKPMQTLFDKLYNNDDVLSQMYKQARAAREEILQKIKSDIAISDPNSISTKGFAKDASMLGTLMRHDPTMQTVFLSIGGWDTHINQGAESGMLSKRLGDLADGLAALKKSLFDRYKYTRIVVFSEFGRTLHENGTGGTDHGHGGLFWIMGGGYKGKTIQGTWPDLVDDNLQPLRELQVTTSYNDLLSEVIGRHFDLSPQQRKIIFQ